MPPIETLIYTYRFRWPTGDEKEFPLQLDKATLDLASFDKEKKKTDAQWMKLEFCQCTVCLLSEKEHFYCPIAVRLVDLIDFFSHSVSYEDVEITIAVPERSYFKRTSLQAGLSSLMGIYMVSSGCPVMQKLKPMVRFHLPFASLLETKYRAFSMYLLAQYFLHSRGRTADWELAGLVKIYDDVRNVNLHFSKRLRAMMQEDASMNALIILNTFADSMLLSLDRNAMDELELLFQAYFNEEE